MKRLLSFLTLLMLLVLLAPLMIAGGQTSDWEPVGTGVDYREFTLPDPNNAYVARMERSNGGVTIDSSVSNGRLAGGFESVSAMAARYDDALNYWGGSLVTPTWGLRNNIIVAINGSYYNKSTGVPQGGQVQSGWYAKRFDDLGGGSGFGWTLSRNAFIGECVNHRPEKQLVTYVSTGVTQQINGINVERGDDQLVLYTPQYDSTTLTDNKGVEVLVEMTRPDLIVPSPAYAIGYVREIRLQKGSTPIPFDHVVLSASGTATETLVANVHIGDEIHISQEITSYLSDCVTPRSLSWTKTYASVQGSFLFLRDGVIQDFEDPGATEKNPRTAIAFNDQYVYFIVVDGRDVRHSLGMTIHELALFARDTLGAVWGIAQDGGGSSTMVVNGEVKNNVYCNNVFCMAEHLSYLPMVSKNTSQSLLREIESRPSLIDSDYYERRVANGMMMVAVLPMGQSTSFHVGETVTTTVETGLYLGPGTNYAALITLPAGARGFILDHMDGLDGVRAKGDYWWKVAFSDGTGWVPQSSLVGAGR